MSRVCGRILNVRGYFILHSNYNRPRLKVIIGFILGTILIALYLIGDIRKLDYSRLIQKRDSAPLSSYFSYVNTNATNLTKKADGYIVWNPSCRIPDIEPFDESIKSLFAKQKLPKCSSLPMLTSLKRINATAHVLILHQEQLKKYAKNKEVTCCYSTITRINLPLDSTSTKADDLYDVGKCTTLKSNHTFTGDEEFVKVVCSHKNGKSTKDVYVNMHAFIGNVTRADEKVKYWKSPEAPKEKLGVMIIGLDSISRLNLLRTMPKTASYLEKNDWFTLKGYNKIDDNTYPNLMAIMTGRTVAQIKSECWPNYQTKLDECPIIWKNFTEQNYITAYGEDEPAMSSFNYKKVGFVKRPVDFYMRPFYLAAEKYTKIKIVSGLNVCLGPTLSIDHILNYSLEFALQFNNVPTFSLFWMNSMSHNELNSPTAIDSKMLTYLQDMNNTGILNSTFIIYVSDHGMRFGKIRETHVGHMEERLPYIYFWLPDWYRKKYPEIVENLKTNTYRLTSPYDVYMTIADILGEKLNGTKACPSCHSLFDEIPWKRSCGDAGITNHWCTCAEYKTLSTHTPRVKDIALYIIAELNRMVLNPPKSTVQNGTKCARLELKSVVSFRSKVFYHQDEKEEFVILLSTLPGDGLFEATVSHENTYQIVDSISRINSYFTQSKCVSDFNLKKYCFCQNSE